MIESVLWFDEPVDWTRLRTVCDERLVDPYPRFRQRVVEPRLLPGVAFWEDDPEFDLDRHLLPSRLEPPCDRATLQRFVSAHMGQPLTNDRPLWQAHLIDGYHGGAAIHLRIHHAVGDGISLVRVLLALVDEDAAEPLFHACDGAASAAGSGPVGHLGARVAAVTATTRHLAADGLGRSASCC